MKVVTKQFPNIYTPLFSCYNYHKFDYEAGTSPTAADISHEVATNAEADGLRPDGERL